MPPPCVATWGLSRAEHPAGDGADQGAAPRYVNALEFWLSAHGLAGAPKRQRKGGQVMSNRTSRMKRRIDHSGIRSNEALTTALVVDTLDESARKEVLALVERLAGRPMPSASELCAAIDGRWSTPRKIANYQKGLDHERQCLEGAEAMARAIVFRLAEETLSPEMADRASRVLHEYASCATDVAFIEGNLEKLMRSCGRLPRWPSW